MGIISALIKGPSPTEYTVKLDRLESVLKKARDLTYMLSPTYIKPICVNTADLSKELDQVIAEVSTIRKEIGV